MEDTVLQAESLRRFCEECLVASGASREDAHIVADSLVESDLRGVGSHGVTRMGIYVKRLRMGLINPRPDVKVLREDAATLLVDGDNGLGQAVAIQALDLGLAKAKQAICSPGDIVVGDADGLVFVPSEEAEYVAEQTKKKNTQETETMRQLADGKVDRSWVDQALKQRGCQWIGFE